MGSYKSTTASDHGFQDLLALLTSVILQSIYMAPVFKTTIEGNSVKISECGDLVRKPES